MGSLRVPDVAPFDVEFDAELKCPVCEESIAVVAEVDVRSGSSQKVGQSGFRSPILTVHLESEVKKIKIHHECVYERKKD